MANPQRYSQELLELQQGLDAIPDATANRNTIFVEIQHNDKIPKIKAWGDKFKAVINTYVDLRSAITSSLHTAQTQGQAAGPAFERLVKRLNGKDATLTQKSLVDRFSDALSNLGYPEVDTVFNKQPPDFRNMVRDFITEAIDFRRWLRAAKSSLPSTVLAANVASQTLP